MDGADTLLIHLKQGQVVNDYKVLKQLGEGGCGVVYKVCNGQGKRFAMKVEGCNIKKEDQLLPIEVLVLKKMQFSPFAVRLIQFATTPDFRMLVMGLLGPSLSALQDEQPRYIFSISTVLRVGFQALQAMGHLHSIFFIHRDIKPGNFAIDQVDCRRVYILDFGLCRSFKKKGKHRMRMKRKSVPFRGTPTFCSPNAHRKVEHGRHDDIWSLIYMLVDFTTGNLPWHRHSRASTGAIKAALWDSQYMHGCPVAFSLIISYLKQLTYYDRPDYEGLERTFVLMMKVRGIRWNQPMDWEKDFQKKRITTRRSLKKAQLEAGSTKHKSRSNKLTLTSLHDISIV